MAGTSVDVALFPLDTVKTRLQSAEGFWRSGGFRGIYRGLSVAAAGSAPGGASVVYLRLLCGVVSLVCLKETAVVCGMGSGVVLQHVRAVQAATLAGIPGRACACGAHGSRCFWRSGAFCALVLCALQRGVSCEESDRFDLTLAVVGWQAACLVRVPTEVVKQRMQAGKLSHVLSGAASIYRAEGIRGFYRGYGATVLREVRTDSDWTSEVAANTELFDGSSVPSLRTDSFFLYSVPTLRVLKGVRAVRRNLIAPF